MYFVSFSLPKVIEYRDGRAFLARVRAWLHQREGENTYIISLLPRADQPCDPAVRLFAVEQDEAIVAAGILAGNGALCMTWAAPEAVNAVVGHALKNQWKIQGTCAPAHVSRELAHALCEHTKDCYSLIRTERVFQVTHVADSLPAAEGRLEIAHPADKPWVRQWFEAFIRDSGFKGDVAQDPRAVDWLIDPRRLYLWKAPEPVAMAAWVAPSINSGCINYVYVPPEQRGKGFGKAIIAALAGQMLASGLRYCFIFSDASDARSNHVYQSVGASGVADLHHFAIAPRVPGKVFPSGESPSGACCPVGSA